MCVKLCNGLRGAFQTFALLPDYFTAVAKQWQDLLWGESVLAIAFALWWFLGNPSTWSIGVYLVIAMFTAGYYVWRFDHLRLIPKLAITEISLTETPTSHGKPILVVHIIPKCLMEAPVHGCKGQLLRVLKWSAVEICWVPTEMDEPLDLHWSIHDNALPRTLHPGVATRINLFFTNEGRQIRLMGDRLPLRWGSVFNDVDTFRFDVRVMAENCPPADVSLGVTMGENWKNPAVGILP
jgi:hypothetical protein